MADIHPMPAREVDVDALERRLRIREAVLIGEIALTRTYLEEVVDEVVKRLGRIQPFTTQWCDAFARQVDCDDLAADPIRSELEDRLGITALWRLADQLVAAHPESYVPTERAD
jgi:hypothetical protein